MPFLVAMAVSIACLPALGRIANKLGIVDKPGVRKIHGFPIPRIGGVAMIIGVLTAAIVVIPLGARERYFLAAAVLLTAFGALDDRFDLHYSVKFVGQLVAALIVVVGAGVQIHSITLDDRVMLLPWVSVPLTVLFLVGITNAINLADGLDGLAGGTTFLCLGALALLAHSGGEIVCASMALAFAGAVLGFLRFNTYPASVFMGDAGSQLLGFAVGVFSVGATQYGDSAISAATPILLLSLPILDTLSVMVQRVGEGRSPFDADKNHIHHKLLKLGFDHHEAVMVIYAIQAALFLMAYWLRYESDLTILAAVTMFFIFAIGLLQTAARRGWHVRQESSRRKESPLTRFISMLREPKNLPRWSYAAVAGSVGLYACLTLTETVSLSGDVEILLLALLAVSTILFAILRVKPLSIVEKAALYVTTTVVVYLDSALLPANRIFSALSWATIGIAALGTVLRLRLASDRRFVLTPLDLIVFFVALVLPNLPGAFALPHGGAGGIAKLVILFYALEVLLSRVDLGVVWLRVAAASLMLGLLLRPLLPL
jgi:UDP-GlcNAc:undecaprenyl-phosphate GlcNAc-1-phosphate transferase